MLNGALLAERCGIDVVCDLRSRDVAAGGHGAPLVPAFHAACFAQPGRGTAVLNIGGIANLTLLPAEAPEKVRGFDTGPGNILLDLWCQRHLGTPYDAGGRWANTGRVNAALLSQWLSEPFFAWPPPKSTGRDLFNTAWLDARLPSTPEEPANIAATLTELTACSIGQAVLQHAPLTQKLLVCGGGAYNDLLLARLVARLPKSVAVSSTLQAGIAPEKVEALAFAWLAKAFVERRPGNLPAVTGASGSRVLGALHPAGAAA